MESDVKRDKRYRRLYSISLAEYEEISKEQGGCCAICRRPPVTVPLNVDHDHKWKYVRINTAKYTTRWFATTFYAGHHIYRPGRTKCEAIQKVRAVMKRMSVRGLLCTNCNPGLRKFSDNSNSLYRAAKYLERHQRGRGVLMYVETD